MWRGCLNKFDAILIILYMFGFFSHEKNGTISQPLPLSPFCSNDEVFVQARQFSLKQICVCRFLL